MEPAEVLGAHVAALDLRGAPVIEVVVRAVGGSDLVFTIADNSLAVGSSAEAVFSVAAHWLDVVDLIEGFGSVDAALVDGRLKVSGDLIAALRWVPVVFSPTGSRRGPASSRRGS